MHALDCNRDYLIAYVMTRKSLETFGLVSLRELADIERLEDEGVLQWPQSEGVLDGALELVAHDEEVVDVEDELGRVE